MNLFYICEKRNFLNKCGNAITCRPTTKMAKRVSCGLDFISPSDITNALQIATESKLVNYLISLNNFDTLKEIQQSLTNKNKTLVFSSGMISLHCQSLIRDIKEISLEVLNHDVSQLSHELI